METIANIFVKYLENLKIDKVFGVPGGVVEPFLNAISKKNSKIEPLNFASENQSCFIAQGYGEAKNSFGVCFSIWGAGETNMVNAVSSAYLSNKKLLIIVASGSQISDSKLPAQDSGSSNGINSLKIFDNITVYNERVTNKHHFEDKLKQALLKMDFHNRPVRLEIPQDLWEEKIDFKENPNLSFIKKPLANVNEIEYLIKTIKNKKINFILGSRSHKIKNIIERISQKYNHNILETSTGKGIVSSNHPNYQGVFGISGVYNERVFDDEFINIFIGDSFNEENTNGHHHHLLKNTIYINDIIDNMNTTFHLKTIYSDIESLFIEIEKHIKTTGDKIKIINIKNKKLTKINKNNKITPKKLIKIFSEISTDRTVAFFDIGNSFLWGIKFWDGKPHIDNLQNFRIGTGLSTMGWALGSSIGHALSRKKDLVFCFIGDGSLLMSSQEILMLKNKNIKIVFIILNDGRLGTVFHGQQQSGANLICNEIPKIDFHSIFKNNGIKSYKIEKSSEIIDISDIIINTEEAIVLDVQIDSSKKPPLSQRIKNLKQDDNG